MKIFMATMGLDIGGAETHIVELAKELQGQGHEVLIASNGGVYVSEIEAAGIRHFSVPMHRRNLKEMRHSRKLLKEIISREKPDIVHAHARIPAFLCGTLQKKLKFPFVTTAHWVFETKGMLRYLTNWGQRTIAVSEDIKAYLMREYQVPEEHITITVNGIDTNKFSPDISGERLAQELGLDLEKPVVSYVSRMDEDRALVARQLIQIAKELDEAQPGIQLVIAGGGNVFQELKEMTEQVNGDLGRTCIYMLGARTDINEIVAAGDIFVGVSRSALEAMSACKPVIVAGNEGYQGLFGPKQLEEAQAGNFCCRGLPMSTPEKLKEDVLFALSLSQEEKQALGAYGRQVIFEFYSVRRMAEDCLKVYRQVKKRKYTVVMSGYYGFSNAGDDAILQSIHEGILAASDEISVKVLSNNPTLTQELCGLEAVNRFQFWKVLSTLKHCDALLSGGGSLLQDRTSTRSLLYYLGIIRMAEFFHKPVMMYANGIGPVRKTANRMRVRRAVERAALVTLRDSSSANELRDMGVIRQDLYVTADPVFNLPPASQERGVELLQTAHLPTGAKFAAISVRDWMDTDGFPEKLATVCDHMKKQHGLEILFILMQPKHDQHTTAQVRQLMKEPSYLLDVPCTPRELMAVLGQAKLCVAMRLHTLIFAARMAVPCVGLVYDPKVESYLKELDMPSAGHVEQFEAQTAQDCIDNLMEHYDSFREKLEEKSNLLAQAAQKNEELLLDLLSKSKQV